jgi:hypothetical protein
MKTILIILASFIISLPSIAQKNEKKNTIAQMVESKQFTFKVQQIMPMNGRSRPLIPEYEMTLMNDSLSVYLPYMGRSYTPDLDPSEIAIQMNTKNFSYSMTPSKRDGWDISIKPKGNRNVSAMEIHISSSGYADMQVNSNTRQSVSYNGYITPINVKKE